MPEEKKQPSSRRKTKTDKRALVIDGAVKAMNAKGLDGIHARTAFRYLAGRVGQ